MNREYKISTTALLFIKMVFVMTIIGFFFIIPKSAEAQLPQINTICFNASSDSACRTLIGFTCASYTPNCTNTIIAQLDAEGGWDPVAKMTVAAANAANAAAIGSYTAVPGCGAGSIYIDCLREIGNFCRFDPSDPGCGTGPNSYRNQLLAAYNQPIVAPPVSATVCAPGDPQSICDAKIRTWCQDNNPPVNVGACITSLSANVYGTSSASPPGAPAASTPTAGSGIFQVTWFNPLATGGITSIDSLVTTILNSLVILATPIVTLMIIYAGFLYVTARGNAEQVKRATTALTYAIIGGLLVLGAVAISGIIQSTITSFTPGP